MVYYYSNSQQKRWEEEQRDRGARERRNCNAKRTPPGWMDVDLRDFLPSLRVVRMCFFEKFFSFPGRERLPTVVGTSSTFGASLILGKIEVEWTLSRDFLRGDAEPTHHRGD